LYKDAKENRKNIFNKDTNKEGKIRLVLGVYIIENEIKNRK